VTLRVLPCGERAVLVELDDGDGALAMHASLRSAALAGVEELVPAARTVLVRFDPGVVGAEALAAAVTALPVGPVPADDGPLVTVGVVYDGEDLAEVAARAGTTVEDVVARHQAATYRVAFVGFTPGFAYLVGGDPALRVPRLATPRPRVPAGSVAIADVYSAVYPTATPGGWRLLGRTDAPVWDPHRDPPALLAPGTRVRFRAVPA
jgi:KipI family sensor histidine kinase inhibitor